MDNLHKRKMPPPVIRTQFFGFPATSLVNKMTNVYIFLESTLDYTMLHSLLALKKKLSLTDKKLCREK